MTENRIEQRAAGLLPEERAAGSADPEAQAEAILAESDEREDDPAAAPNQTGTPDEPTRYQTGRPDEPTRYQTGTPDESTR